MKTFFKQKNRGPAPYEAKSFRSGFTRTPKFGVTPKGGGFTLVEALVAVSIFSMSVLALMSVLGSGIGNTNYAKQKMTAAYLAQEGIEYVRNMRDNAVLYQGGGNWTSFRNTPNISYPADGFPGFGRTVWLDDTGLSDDEIKIFSKVEWNTPSGIRSITFSENLFNWIEP